MAIKIKVNGKDVKSPDLKMKYRAGQHHQKHGQDEGEARESKLEVESEDDDVDASELWGDVPVPDKKGNKKSTPNPSKSDQKNQEDSEAKGDEDEGEGKEENKEKSKEQKSGENKDKDGAKKGYEIGEKIYAEIKSQPFLDKASNKPRIQKEIAIWEILDKKKPHPSKKDQEPIYKVKNAKNFEYWVKESNINERDLQKDLDAKKQREEERKKKEEEKKRKEEEEEQKKKEAEEKEKAEKERKSKLKDSNTLSTPEKMIKLIKEGQINLWLKGPAGSGKSVMCREVAKELDVDYYCISCGAGTSSTEFIGYKYPERIGTPFADFYAKPSVILIDEMTALDASVAQILNASLANNEIETTTGIVRRHPECIIVATSNTFGNGADRMYVANNQLDASTIDRFVGGILEVDYSVDYEAQFEDEVVEFVWDVRRAIKRNQFRRIASTRMIIAGVKLRNIFTDWKSMLLANWEPEELRVVQSLLKPD